MNSMAIAQMNPSNKFGGLQNLDYICGANLIAVSLHRRARLTLAVAQGMSHVHVIATRLPSVLTCTLRSRLNGVSSGTVAAFLSTMLTPKTMKLSTTPSNKFGGLQNLDYICGAKDHDSMSISHELEQRSTCRGQYCAPALHSLTATIRTFALERDSIMVFSNGSVAVFLSTLLKTKTMKPSTSIHAPGCSLMLSVVNHVAGKEVSHD